MASVVLENLTGVNFPLKFAGNLSRVRRHVWAFVVELNLFQFPNSR